MRPSPYRPSLLAFALVAASLAHAADFRLYGSTRAYAPALWSLGSNWQGSVAPGAGGPLDAVTLTQGYAHLDLASTTLRSLTLQDGPDSLPTILAGGLVNVAAGGRIAGGTRRELFEAGYESRIDSAVNALGTLTVDVASSDALALGGSLTLGGLLTKKGEGTLILRGGVRDGGESGLRLLGGTTVIAGDIVSAGLTTLHGGRSDPTLFMSGSTLSVTNGTYMDILGGRTGGATLGGRPYDVAAELQEGSTLEVSEYGSLDLRAGALVVDDGSTLNLGYRGQLVAKAVSFAKSQTLTLNGTLYTSGLYVREGAPLSVDVDGGLLSMYDFSDTAATVDLTVGGGAPGSVASLTLRNGGGFGVEGALNLVDATSLITVDGTREASSVYTRDLAGAAGSRIALNGTGATVYLHDGSGNAFEGAISGEGRVQISNGSYAFTGPNSYTGGTAIYGGKLKVAQPNGAYALGYEDQVDGDLEIENAGAGTATRVTGRGAFVKSGAGALTLTDELRNGGTTTLAGGALRLQGRSTSGKIVGAAGTTLEFAPTASGVYDGAYSGAGALLKSGGRTTTMWTAPSNSGGMRVAGGTLDVDGAGAFGGGLAVDRYATFLNTSGGTLTIGGRSFVQGEVDTVAGSKTAFTGLVSGAGGFGGFGTVAFEGGYSPGNSPASVTIQGDLELGAANVLTMELGGSVLGSGYDHLTVDGRASLSGALSVVSLGGFAPTAGQSFELFDFGTWEGRFSSVRLPTLGSGLVWNTSALYSAGTISAQAVPEPAPILALALPALALLRRRRRA